MKENTKRFWVIINTLLIVLGFLGCDKDDVLIENNYYGTPVELDFCLGNGEKANTRAQSPLPTSDVVYVTADNGKSWCKYVYSSDSNIWKPAEGETPILWTDATITLFAIVRHDGGTTGSTVTIQSDQTTAANYEASDFLGVRGTYSYGSGKIQMVLSHRVCKMTVVAKNTPATDLTCSTTVALPTSGTFSLGYSNIDLTSTDTPTSTISLYKEDYDSTNKITYFSAYVFPQTGVKTNFTFTSSGKTITITVSYNLPDFGVAFDTSCITKYEITLPDMT